MLYIGLMSGTSANGIDAALVDVTDDGLKLLATHSADYSPGTQESIESTIRRYPEIDAGELCRLNEALGADFARAALSLIDEAGLRTSITAIGSHGQTVYHGPGDTPPTTVQLGDPQRIADLTGLTTIGDFRRNDMRAGGQGAPLAPALHNALFRSPATERLIVNIGGIANLTYLPADPDQPVLGFDTGPGNTLLDQWCRLHTGEVYDRDGRWAAQGRADPSFVRALLDDPYFQMRPPKSTGREYFNLDWMKKRWATWREQEPVDIQAGLLEVTTRSIAEAGDWACNECYEMYVCGGGAHNTALISRLAALAAGGVETTDALGLAPDWVEACAFAWLAHRRLHDLPGNLPSVTGADEAVPLGEIFVPQVS